MKKVLFDTKYLYIFTIVSALSLTACSESVAPLEAVEVGNDVLLLNHKTQEAFGVTREGLIKLPIIHHEDQGSLPPVRHNFNDIIHGGNFEVSFISKSFDSRIFYKIDMQMADSPANDANLIYEWIQDISKRNNQLIIINFRDEDSFRLHQLEIKLDSVNSRRLVNEQGEVIGLSIEDDEYVDVALMRKVETVSPSWNISID